MSFSTSTQACGRVLAALLFPLAVAAQVQRPRPVPAADSLTLRHYLLALQDDSVTGRHPGTAGMKKATRWLETHFLAAGLTAISPEGYRQTVYLKRGHFYNTTSVGIGEERFYLGNDLLMQLCGRRDTSLTFPPEAIVRLGYGLHDSINGIDDYAGKDVKGKLVVVLDGVPAGQEGRIRNADWFAKVREASRHGARGMITLRPVSQPRQAAPETRQKTSEMYDPYSFGDFVAAEIHDVNRFEGALARGGSVNFRIDQEPLTDPNILGALPGTDPKLRDEWIVVTAHYDHLGRHGTGPDRIFNGALDNASGTAALLHCAELLRQSQPARSILFLATTGEEMGFYGAEAFLRSELIPKKKIVANINLDILGFQADPHERVYMMPLGSDYSTLGRVFRQVAARHRIGITPNYVPSFYFRSDNIAFARAGIPALHAAVGARPHRAWNAYHVYEQFYHTPADQYPGVPLRFGALAQECDVVTDLLLTLANDPEKPHMTKKLPADSSTFADLWGGVRMWLRRII